MLRSIDLFSGIGGITHALHGLCKPLAYCDFETDSILCLSRNMDRGNLPFAPICHDVCTMNDAWLNEHNVVNVDIVVGGFPCVGFSPLGCKKGVRNEQSKLFFEIMRILDLTESPMVFLENVPNILKLGMHIVRDELCQRGYELRWCVVSAAQVGAHHERKRWFCLGIKAGFDFHWKYDPNIRKSIQLTNYLPFRWDLFPPERSVPDDSLSVRVRASLLGNSVVPDAVRYAFIHLVTRCNNNVCHKLDLEELRLVMAKQPEVFHEECVATFPTCGIIDLDGCAFEAPQPPFLNFPQSKMQIILDPSLYVSDKQPSPLMSTDIVSEVIVRSTWSTPRHGMLRPCNYMTVRSVRDLPSQVRFEKGTEFRDGSVNPQFIEWLMGFPKDWTL